MSLRWRPTGALISLLALSAAVTAAALLAWALPIPRWGAALLAFADEEGLLKSLPQNAKATAFLGHAGPMPLVGPVIIVAQSEDGESIEPPQAVFRALGL